MNGILSLIFTHSFNLVKLINPPKIQNKNGRKPKNSRRARFFLSGKQVDENQKILKRNKENSSHHQKTNKRRIQRGSQDYCFGKFDYWTDRLYPFPFKTAFYKIGKNKMAKG